MYTESKIVVRYAETDKMGIVHHSVYPIWYEVARTDFIKKVIGISYSEFEKMGIMTPIVELNSKYISPADYEDELLIKVFIRKLTPARIEFEYEVKKEQDEKIINKGYTVHAWVSKDLKPLNMKKKYPDLYEKLEKIEIKEKE